MTPPPLLTLTPNFCMQLDSDLIFTAGRSWTDGIVDHNSALSDQHF